MDFRIVDYDPKYLNSLKTVLEDSDLYWPMSLQQTIPLTIEEVANELKERDTTFMWLAVSKNNQEVAGFLNYTPHPREIGVGYIALLNVRPSYFRMGIGRALLEKAIHETAALGCPRVDLHTWNGNYRALPLYKELGFLWAKDGRSTRLENYLPLLLNYPPLKPYFRKYCWQNTLISNPPFEEDFTPGNSQELLTYKFSHGELAWEATVDRITKQVASVKTPDLYCSSDLRIPAGDPEKIVAGLTLNENGESDVNFITSTKITENCPAETEVGNIATTRANNTDRNLNREFHNFSPQFHENSHDITERHRAIISLPDKLQRSNYQPGELTLTQYSEIKPLHRGESFQIANSRRIFSPCTLAFEEEPVPNLTTGGEDTLYLRIKNTSNKALEVYCQINSNGVVTHNIPTGKATDRKRDRSQRWNKVTLTGNGRSTGDKHRNQHTPGADMPLVFSILLDGKEERSLPIRLLGVQPGMGTINVVAKCEQAMLSPRALEQRQATCHIPVFAETAHSQVKSADKLNLQEYSFQSCDHPLPGELFGYYQHQVAKLESRYYMLEVDRQTGEFSLYDKPLIKEKECKIGGKLLTGKPIQPGPPFRPHEFNYQVPKVSVNARAIYINFSSKKYPGVTTTTTLSLAPEGRLTVSGTLSNASGRQQALSTRFRSEVPERPDMKLFAPLTTGPLIENILSNNFPVENYDFPKAADKFSEPNYTISFPERDVTCEFPTNADIDLGNNSFPTINLQYQLEPGEIQELPVTKFHFYRKKFHDPGSKHQMTQSGSLQLQPDIQTVGLATKSAEFSLVTRKNKPVDGRYRILDEQGHVIKNRRLYLSPREERHEEKIKLELPEKRVINYTLDVMEDTRSQFDIPVVRTGDYRRKVHVNMGDWIDRDTPAQNAKPIEISNNSLEAEIRPEFSGSIVRLSENEHSKRDNLLYSTYPQETNFSWFYPYHGGITPYIHHLDEPFPGKHLLNYQVPGVFPCKEQVLGKKFQGISLEYYLESKLKFSVQYLTLPGSNLWYSRLQVTNQSNTVNKVAFGLLTTLALEEDEGALTNTEGKTWLFPRKYPKGYSTRNFATVTARDYAAALLSPGHMISLLDGGSIVGSILQVNSTQTLLPGSSTSLQLLTAFTGKQKEAAMYRPLQAQMFI